MADYDLAYKKITELTTETNAPASGDYNVRWDTSAGGPVKVDATDLSASIGVSATAAVGGLEGPGRGRQVGRGGHPGDVDGPVGMCRNPIIARIPAATAKQRREGETGPVRG